MIHSLKHYSYKGYDIFLMHDTGAHWYQIEKDGEFIMNCDSEQEFKIEINLLEAS